MTEPKEGDRVRFITPDNTGRYGMVVSKHDEMLNVEVAKRPSWVICNVPIDDVELDPTPREGDLRVWHIPQIPMKPFYVAVSSIDEGKRICEILADYDLFQFDNKIKPDYANVNGIQRYSEDLDGELGEPGWIDVEEDEEDEDI